MTGSDGPAPETAPARARTTGDRTQTTGHQHRATGDRPGAPGDRALAEFARRYTVARVFTGRAGTSYRTSTQLDLRADHAAARDAVDATLDLDGPPLAGMVAAHGMVAVRSEAATHAEHLLRPDLGRRLPPEAAATLRDACPPRADVQLVVGDGLSATAVARQVPDLLPRLVAAFRDRGRTVGRPFVVRHCRVGILNDVGAVLGPAVVILLVGERPGLATAESLSAYLAYRPLPGHTDADRNLVSNIHAGGLPVPEATARIVALAEELRRARASGVTVRPPEPAPGPAATAASRTSGGRKARR